MLITVANRTALGAAMPKPSEVLVYIDADGSVRELSAAEKKYVDAEFSPFDGARPCIKSRYWERTACSELTGYLHRQEVPIGIPIGSAPLVDPPPHTPQTAAVNHRIDQEA